MRAARGAKLWAANRHVPGAGGRQGSAGRRAGRARRRLGPDGQQPPRQAHRRPHPARRAAGALALLPPRGRRGGARGGGAGRGGAAAAARRIETDGIDSAAKRLKEARTCYSHLAGRLGVALADALVAARWLEDDGRSYRVTPKGARSLRGLGIEANGRRAQAPARRCLDWTERRAHVAGPVGTALAELALRRGWVRRLRDTRAVRVTPSGRTQLQRVFNVRYQEGAP